MVYKYLLFDADNTLFDFDMAERRAISEVFLKYGIDLKYISRYSEINKSFWKMLEKGTVTREQLKVERFRVLFEEIGKKYDEPEKISQDYIEYLSMQNILYENSIDVCKHLFLRGYAIYIITNGNEYVQKRRFDNSEIKKYISGIFISESIGYKKPSKEFFDYVMENARLEREKCLIIGDSLSSDILGGVNSGIDTCWLNLKDEINTNSFKPTYTINNLNGIFGVLGEKGYEIR